MKRGLFVEFGPDSKQYCESAEGVKTSCPPTHYVPEQGEIWRNTQDRRFEMVPPEQGMQATSGVGLVLAFADLDDDRRMELIAVFHCDAGRTPAFRNDARHGRIQPDLRAE